MAENQNNLYQSKPAIANKFLNPTGETSTLDEIITQVVPGTTLAETTSTPTKEYQSKPAVANKFLNTDGTYSTLDEILARTIGGITQFDVEVVEELPEVGEKGVLYLVPNEGSGGNIYDEYVWIPSTESFEKIGTTEIDLSGYEQLVNKVTSISASSTNTQYPSAKLLYDQLATKVNKSGDTMTGALTTTALTVGNRTTGSDVGRNSFVSGSGIASNDYSVAINFGTATGEYAFASNMSTASGTSSHAEGLSTTASTYQAHSEGTYTLASGYSSHAEGGYTIAQRKYQHVEGEYNIADTTGNDTVAKGSYINIVGNGTDDNSRSNAHTLDWSGNAWFAGDVYVGSTSGTNKDAGSKKLLTADDLPKTITLTGDYTWLAPGEYTISTAEEVAKLEELETEIRNGSMPNFGFELYGANAKIKITHFEYDSNLFWLNGLWYTDFNSIGIVGIRILRETESDVDTWTIQTEDCTYIPDFVGASIFDNGYRGLVPTPSASDVDKYLKADGTWASVPNPSNITQQEIISLFS